MENMRKLPEELAKGIMEVKTSQAELKERQDKMKTGLTDEIKSVKD